MSSEESLDSCFIGTKLMQSCHLFVSTRKAGLKQVSSLDARQIKLISLRTGLDSLIDKIICLYHEQTMLVKYSHSHRKCCNPFSKHMKNVKTDLQEIALEVWADLQKLSISVIPGHKMCPTCRTELSRRLKSFNKETEEAGLPDAYESDVKLEHDLNSRLTRENLDSIMVDMDLSPMKLHAAASHSMVFHGKRKVKQVNAKLKEQEESRQKQKIAEVIHVVPEALQVRDRDHPQIMRVIHQKAEDLDVLAHLMKDELKFLSRQKKVQLLTIVPHSWSIQKAKEEL